jgi:hypothetical protein
MQCRMMMNSILDLFVYKLMKKSARFHIRPVWNFGHCGSRSGRRSRDIQVYFSSLPLRRTPPWTLALHPRTRSQEWRRAPIRSPNWPSSPKTTVLPRAEASRTGCEWQTPSASRVNKQSRKEISKAPSFSSLEAPRTSWKRSLTIRPTMSSIRPK